MNDKDPNPDQWPGRTPEEGPISGSWPADPHDTTPIETPAAAPVGLTTEDAEPAPAPVDWQQRYEGERRRSRIFIAAAAVAGALTVGSLFYASAQGGSTPADPTDQQAGQLGPGGQMPGMPDHDDDRGTGRDGPMGAGPGMGFGGTIEGLFNADGSLNSEAVEQFQQQLAGSGTDTAAIEQRLAAHIAGDVARGHLTQAQADELLAALGIDSSAGGSDDTATT